MCRAACAQTPSRSPPHRMPHNALHIHHCAFKYRSKRHRGTAAPGERGRLKKAQLLLSRNEKLQLASTWNRSCSAATRASSRFFAAAASLAAAAASRSLAASSKRILFASATRRFASACCSARVLFVPTAAGFLLGACCRGITGASGSSSDRLGGWRRRAPVDRGSMYASCSCRAEARRPPTLFALPHPPRKTPYWYGRSSQM